MRFRLDGVMALILLYFTEFGSFSGALGKSVRVRCHRKKFTFTRPISSPGEFLVSI